MPTNPTYPGVYIQEVPSGVRTITGVSTSIAAFIGYTKKGPLDKAEEVFSFADYERKFGGLSKDSPVSYAVQQFFMNGGQQAYVVKIAKDAKEASVTLASGLGIPVIEVKAIEPGAWYNGILIRIDYNTAHPESTFNLRVENPKTADVEEYSSLTMNTGSRRNVDKIVNASSKLINVKTFDNVFDDIETDRGESISVAGINPNGVNPQQYQFMITLNEEDGPRQVRIYNGVASNPFNNLTDLADKITAAVKNIDPAKEPYKSFICTPNVEDKQLTLTSGFQGDNSFVRVTSANEFDVTRVLKLGVANGGRELDAAAEIRPAAMGTTSGNLADLPDFTDDRSIMVSLDGDGPHEVLIYKHGTDTPPTNLSKLSNLIQTKIQAVKPNQKGSMVFKGTTVKPTSNSIQILSGADDPNSIVNIDNVRVQQHLNDVSFINDNDGWAVGDEGTILHYTNDGSGGSWIKVTVHGISNITLRSVHFIDNDDGWAVGDKGTILHYTDDGSGALSWTMETVTGISNITLRSVHFIDNDDGWAVGDDGTILHYTDDGSGALSWTMETVTGISNITLRSVYFIDTNNGWAVGDAGTILHYSVDGGVGSWTLEHDADNSPITDSSLNGIFFRTGSNKGLAVGNNGIVLYTNNLGVDWSIIDHDLTDENLNAVYMKLLSDVKIVGDNGIILHWDDVNLSEVENIPINNLNAIQYFNNNLCAVGDNGTILHFISDGAGGGIWDALTAYTNDKLADDLNIRTMINGSGSPNVNAYTLGIGRIIGAQTGATSGQDGERPEVNEYLGSEAKKKGIYALIDVDIFNLLCLPEITGFDLNDAIAILSTAVSYCKQRRAFLIMDCPNTWNSFDSAIDKFSEFDSVRSENAAMYFPLVKMPDILDENRLRSFPPCGIVAGIFARTDAERGVWKAPAGQEATLSGARSMVYKLNDRENGMLNPMGLNCLRTFPVIGPIIWGARTLDGADVLASEWKYIPVRRIALFIEESLYRGLKWVVFEPNDEPLWSQIRLNVGSFMHRLFRQGAFQGSTAKEAFFVKCSSETTTQTDINLGIVNIEVGFAPLKPAEFVIIKIQQMAGQIQT